jgi:chromate transporter
MVLVAGWAYVTYQGLDWLQALFYGVGAAVIAIIAHQATKLTRRTLGRDRLLGGIFLVIAAVTVVTESENGLLILAAGVLVWLVRADPAGCGSRAAGGVWPPCSSRSRWPR